MTRNRVEAERQTNSQISQEGIKMASLQLSSKRSVMFKVLAIGLASLVLILAGSGSTMLAHGSMSPPPPGFMFVLVNGQAMDCAKGTPIQGAEVDIFSKQNKDLKVETTTDSEGKFSALAILFGSDLQSALPDMGVDFPGFEVVSMTSAALQLGTLTLISVDACLQGDTLVIPADDGKFEAKYEFDYTYNPHEYKFKIKDDDNVVIDDVQVITPDGVPHRGYAGETPNNFSATLQKGTIQVIIKGHLVDKKKEGKFTHHREGSNDSFGNESADDKFKVEPK